MGFKSYYTTNINDPRIRRWDDAYRKKLGLPIWCPMTDAERREFDAKVNALLAAEAAEQGGKTEKSPAVCHTAGEPLHTGQSPVLSPST